MSNWHPIVVRLNKIGRHPNAETLEISTVLGDNTVIFKENQYKPGDLVSYIPYDTICSDNPVFDFLGDKKRIKPARLRGIFSEGIIVPAPPNAQEGDSVVEYYGLTKHEYEEEKAANDPADTEKRPSHINIPHYDLENLRKYVDRFQDGEEVIIAEKCEGENACVFHDGERLWVRSRNLFKVDRPGSHWWEAVRNTNLPEGAAKNPLIAFFGELIGRVKHFQYDCTPKQGGGFHPTIRIFDIWDIPGQKFLEWDDVERICADIGVETVPILYRGAWKTDKSLYELGEGNSALGSFGKPTIKEGLVIRPAISRFDTVLNDRLVLKLKGMDYQIYKGKKS